MTKEKAKNKVGKKAPVPPPPPKATEKNALVNKAKNQEHGKPMTPEAMAKRIEHNLSKMGNDDKVNLAIQNIENVCNQLKLDTCQIVTALEFCKYSTIMSATEGGEDATNS